MLQNTYHFNYLTLLQLLQTSKYEYKKTYDFLVFESLEIFEFPLGCLVTFYIRLVKDFHAADFTPLVDIGSNIETAFGKVA